MVFSLEHDIKVTKNHQNLLPTQSVLVAHPVLLFATYWSTTTLHKVTRFFFVNMNVKTSKVDST
jgi:hypothetical protein